MLWVSFGLGMVAAARYRARATSQEHRRQLWALVQDIQLQLANVEDPLWIGICGVPGAGKTTLAGDLQQALVKAGISCAVVPMDGYHYYRSELDQMPDPEQAHRLRGAPFTFDSSRFASDLLRKKLALKQGQAVQGGVEVAPHTQIVLVEGNYLLLWKPELALDYCYFLQIDLQVAKQRLARRHSQAWNWSLEAALQRVEQSDYANMVLVQTTKPLADKVVYTS
ncbi:hypothetical protein BASA81_001637 [Batrachochytrium salamandrivorans]|nr:hypothetical protein BASA81_001637 [Batrachochytrium salamandrivorans]